MLRKVWNWIKKSADRLSRMLVVVYIAFSSRVDSTSFDFIIFVVIELVLFFLFIKESKGKNKKDNNEKDNNKEDD